MDGLATTVLVAIKRLVGCNVSVRVKEDGSGVETANVMPSMNPFGEIGLEKGVLLKKRGQVTPAAASASRGRSGIGLAWSSVR